MARPVALVTGASGEMGHRLLPELPERGYDVVALDLAPLPGQLASGCLEAVQGSILDSATLGRLLRRHRPERVFHLAAVLSARAEEDPGLAHAVNVEGTLSLINLCREEAARAGRPVRFLFPSSIAVYGLPDAGAKRAAGAVKESDWNRPIGIYGCNKLYCEMLGDYFSRRAASDGGPGLDFRCIRFPGLISTQTVPTGGTTDYAPGMIHAAARGKPYTCFVRAETRLPFMTMSDAVEAFVKLAEAPPESLPQRVFNIRSFSPSAGEIRDLVLEHYPQARITFEPDPRRQATVDSWPADVDDQLARRSWGFAPRHGLREAFGEYLIPALRARYERRPVGTDEDSVRS